MPGLATYYAKRDFGRTPEPRGALKRRPTSRGPQYVVQKHDASHLHYDFRLEIGGVLVSWAVPKGPSLDPHAKRLAVRTEDHPLAYGGFEGTIPKGEYGGGTVLLWDRGTWEPIGNPAAGLKKGTLKFNIHGERLRGEFVLTRLKPRSGEKRENWLLIKRNDEDAAAGSGDDVVRANPDSVASRRDLGAIASDKGRQKKSTKTAAPTVKSASAARGKSRSATHDRGQTVGSRKAAMPRKIKPQLATLVEEAPGESGWLSEIKFDGYRMLVRINARKIQIFSRNGHLWTDKLPEIAAALAKIEVRQAWLDGELIAIDASGKSDFGKLKDAFSLKPPRGLILYVFDVLYHNGRDLSRSRQDDRKAVLERLLQDAPAAIKYSEHFDGVPDRVREHACAMGLEGIICKRADAPYRQARSKNWLKLKCIQREEFVVIGFTDPQGSRDHFGALHVGYYDADGALHYAGGVGTGFDRAMLKSLHSELAKLERRIGLRLIVHGEGPPKGMHWVAPKMVIETRYLEMTSDKILRHAVFMGVRKDKTAEEVVRDPPGNDVARVVSANSIVTAAAPRAQKKRKQMAGSRKRNAPAPAIVDNRKSESGAAKLTHPERQLWPADGLTKADLAAYWAAIADLALPHIAGRPLAVVRCPDGIEQEHFFQKKASAGFPKQIADLKVGKDRVMAIADAAGLRALAQMSAIELHPWGSRVENIENPDRLIFDLDPDQGLDFALVVSGAISIREALDEVGLKSFCKTTGGKGLHVVVPIRPTLGWAEAKAFAAVVAKTLAAAEPKRFVATMSKAARKGRVFIDYLRNGRGATAIAPFSPRARPGGTIAMPLEWRELDAKLDPSRYSIADPAAMARIGKARWMGFFDVDQEIGAKARKQFALK